MEWEEQSAKRQFSTHGYNCASHCANILHTIGTVVLLRQGNRPRQSPHNHIDQPTSPNEGDPCVRKQTSECSLVVALTGSGKTSSNTHNLPEQTCWPAQHHVPNQYRVSSPASKRKHYWGKKVANRCAAWPNHSLNRTCTLEPSWAVFAG